MPRKVFFAIFAAATCVAGVIAVPAPSGATPSKDCDWTIFATDSDIAQSSGHTGHVSWNSNNGGRLDIPTPDDGLYSGAIQGPVIVKGTNELAFSVTADNNVRTFTNTYGGTIDPNGSASGTWHNDQGGSGTWTMGNTFKCIGKAASAPPPEAEKQTPPPPPEVAKPVTDAIKLAFGAPKFGSITATVSNSSNLPGQCTYDATPFDTHRDFSVAAKGSTPLTFNGFNTGTTYHAVVVCNDSSGTQTEPIGRAETDVTF
jgi:hypothetical protein